MSQTEVVEKIKTHFIFNNLLFESRAIYEIMWKNIVGPDKATNAHSEYVILIAFPLQQKLREGVSMFHCSVVTGVRPRLVFS